MVRGHSSHFSNEYLAESGMANPLVPTGPPAAAMNSQEIGFLVRNWVHYDNLATGLYRQTINARKVRDEFETKILESLRSSNMENAVIQIAGGRLIVQQERHNQPLTLTRIEEILHTYYVGRNMPDDTANVMKFMKKQRGFEVTKKLRKQTNPPLAPLPPPPLG
jgi:hypothetical protein